MQNVPHGTCTRFLQLKLWGCCSGTSSVIPTSQSSLTFDVCNVNRTLRHTGSFPQGSAERQQQLRVEDGVLDGVHQSTHLNMYRILTTNGVILTQTWSILHTGGFCVYHLQRLQHLLPEDHALRVWYYERLQAHLDVLPDVLFTDEAQFTRDCINSTQISHSTAHGNPQKMAELSLPCFTNEFSGLPGNYLIAPHFIQGILTAAYHKDFLQIGLLLHLEVLPPATRGQMWILTTERLHIAAQTRQSSPVAVTNSGCIGRGGPVSWHPGRSSYPIRFLTVRLPEV
jgi:hypothetical protein